MNAPSSTWLYFIPAILYIGILFSFQFLALLDPKFINFYMTVLLILLPWAFFIRTYNTRLITFAVFVICTFIYYLLSKKKSTELQRLKPALDLKARTLDISNSILHSYSKNDSPHALSLCFSAAVLAYYYYMGNMFFTRNYPNVMAYKVPELPMFIMLIGSAIILCRMSIYFGFPSMGIVGRIYHRQFIIPGYDKIFIAPILAMAVLIWFLFTDNPLLNSLQIFIFFIILLIIPPSLRNWQLLGKRRRIHSRYILPWVSGSSRKS
ncbi:MAG: hypothetical protein HRT89_23960 [Lentisphaeria bacterium]|nr:hypothetical protein [Lentisphaeria bacterium]